MLGERLRELRASTGLDESRFASLAGVELARLVDWERGRIEPSPEETNAATRVVGARLQDLATAGGWPLAPFLFRSSLEPGLHALEHSRTFGTFGEFLRVSADILELEALVGIPLPELPKLVPPPSTQAPWGADRLAVDARRRLGLSATEPIVSMRMLVEELGVWIVFVTPDELLASFEGASTVKPRPMILVNLVGGNLFWRVRMVLAHELGHLLFDHDDVDEPVASLSAPESSRQMSLFADYWKREARADAFAAIFLAPDAGVRLVVGALDPSSDRAIEAVGRTFGVGRITAINRLRDVYHLDDRARAAMLQRKLRWAAEFDADVPTETGLRGSRLAQLVGQAIFLNKLDRVRARSILDLALSDALPETTELDEAIRRPLRTAHGD